MKYFVSRQNYWDRCAPEASVVEIVCGGINFANPDMLVAKWPELGEGKEFDDPREAVEAAINICEEWKKTDEYASVGMGVTGGFTMSFDGEDYEALRKRASEMWEKLPKCAHCGGLLGKETFFHDFDPEAKYCREYCAERAYLQQVEDDLEALEKFDTPEECKAAGVHLDSCDDDGFCHHCGHQDEEE